MGPDYRFIFTVAVGMVLVGGVAAFASSGYSKNFFSRFGQASISTWNDVVGKDDLKLVAEVELTPAATSSLKTTDKRETAPSQNQIPKTDIASSILSSVTNSQIVKDIEKISGEVIITTTSPTPPPPVKIPEPSSTLQAQEGSLKQILIYVVQIAGPENVDQDFISLFNPNWKELDISKWRLVRKTKTGSEDSIKVFPAGSVIPSKGKFVWANSGYASIDANVRTSDKLAKDNSVALLDVNKNVVDAVAWGSGTSPYIEGSPAPNPKISLARKLDQDFMPIDTNNNLSDFEIK